MAHHGYNLSHGYDMFYDYSLDDYYTDHLYTSFSFERTIYLYLWVILVSVTVLINVLVISVLLRRQMRSPAHMILVLLAISDSLTGLVTLPAYIAVHSRQPHLTEVPTIHPNFINISEFGELFYTTENFPEHSDLPELAYMLSEELCDGFMISKFFLSKAFHTVSVWLTVFLALQRFLCLSSSFGRCRGLLTMKKTIVVCVVIFALSPVLHVYHLVKDESPPGHCRWTVSTGERCDADCIYLWFAMVLGHLLPAVMLAVLTVYFVVSLRRSAAWSLQLADTPRDTSAAAEDSPDREGRRMSQVVMAILVVFLIPEIPYACFLLYVAVFAHAELPLNHRATRTIHAAYEILMILSFSANFYIYTFFSRRFRQVLKATVVDPVCNVFCSDSRCGRAGCGDELLPEDNRGCPLTELNTTNLPDETDIKDAV